jgi:hypothetical protein
MRHRNLNRLLLLLLAFSLCGLIPVRTAMADLSVTYDVSINTTSIATSSGFIDFQFNPADATSLLATATAFNFSTDGVVGMQAFQSGDATGPATGPLTTLSFDNGTALNELTYDFTYGTFINFDVTLMQSGTGGDGSTFALTLFDPNGNAFSNTGVNTATITINPDGSTTGTAFLPFAGVTGSVTLLSAVPEPSTLLLSVIAFGALFGCQQVRRRAVA